MEPKDIEKIIQIIMSDKLITDAEKSRLIIELVKAVNKPPEIKTIPDPYPIYPQIYPPSPTPSIPYHPCTPQWDWTKFTCTGIDPATNENTEVNNNDT